MQCIRTFVEASDAIVFRTVPIGCNALGNLWRLLMLWFFRTVPILCNALEHLWRLLMLGFLGLYLLYSMHWNIYGGF